jgi:hypothetical protein
MSKIKQMKTIRYFAACLLLLTGVLHFLPIIKTPSDPNAVPMLIFGIIYFAIGVLLFLKIKYADLLGFIFPIIGLVIGFFVVGIKNWDAMLAFLFTIDAVVVICCVLLLLNKKNRQ